MTRSDGQQVRAEDLLKRSWEEWISEPKPAVVETILALSGRPTFPEESNSAARRTAEFEWPCNPIAA
jgi:hypothetical protein